MTNSTNKKLTAFVEEVINRYPFASATVIQDHEVAIDIDERDLHSALSFLKNMGQLQLSIITCIDWIEEGRFQLVFNTFDWTRGLRIHLRTFTDRSKSVFKTVTNIYPGAKYYEREIHEYFGIVFEGNADVTKPIFLENWKGMPPYRKDFISETYSDMKYPKRQYETSYENLGGGSVERS